MPSRPRTPGSSGRRATGHAQLPLAGVAAACELLQLGRFNDSLRAIDEIAPVVKATGDLRLLSDQSSMRARYVVETRRWNVMANERNFGNVNELCAIGFSAARLHNPRSRSWRVRRWPPRSNAPVTSPGIAIMERQVAALIELEAGRREQAVAILRAATEAELKLPPPLACRSPSNLLELLGEVLLELGRPGEALQPFGRPWRATPTVELSVLGLARASSALGQADEASRHYRALLANYARGRGSPRDCRGARGNEHGCGEPGRAGRRGGDGHRDRRGDGSGCRGLANARPLADQGDTAAKTKGVGKRQKQEFCLLPCALIPPLRTYTGS